MHRLRLSLAFAFVLALAACGSSPTGTADMASPPDLYTPGAPRSLLVDIALEADSSGNVKFFAQNGAMVMIPKADIANKPYFWATTAGGETVFNGKLLEMGFGTLDGNLTASWKSEAKYTNGPWEMAVFISLTGGDPAKGPQFGDLAAFDNEPPPAGQPQVTGVSVRMTVAGADAGVKLTNRYWIRF